MTLREAYELFMEWQGITSAQTIAWYGVLGSPLIDEYFDDDCDIAWGSYDHFFSEMIRPPAELAQHQTSPRPTPTLLRAERSPLFYLSAPAWRGTDPLLVGAIRETASRTRGLHLASA